MKKLMRTTAAVLLIVSGIFAQNAQAQQDEVSLKIPVFGIGLRGEQLKGYDLVSTPFVPVNKVIFTITPSNKWRIEPTIGYSRMKDETTDAGTSSTQTLSGLFYGLGGFGMYAAGKANIYYGVRLELGTIKEEMRYVDTDFNVDEKYTRKTKRFSVGPVLGAEYFIGHHFSFGGEIALKNYSNKIEETSTSDPNPSGEQSNSFFSTETSLMLRFYF